VAGGGFLRKNTHETEVCFELLRRMPFKYADGRNGADWVLTARFAKVFIEDRPMHLLI
jgi:hypothetical protein